MKWCAHAFLARSQKNEWETREIQGIEKGEDQLGVFGLGHEGRAMRENGAKGDEGIG